MISRKFLVANFWIPFFFFRFLSGHDCCIETSFIVVWKPKTWQSSYFQISNFGGVMPNWTVPASTMWKFQNFPTIKTFVCEIKYGDSRSLKSCHFIAFALWICQHSSKLKFRASKYVEMVVFDLLESLKLVSRKIWVTEKFKNVHTVGSTLFSWLRRPCYTYTVPHT